MGGGPRQIGTRRRRKIDRDLCQAIGQKGNRVPTELYNKIASFFNREQIVALTGFASLMIATNIVKNVLEVDLGEYLYTYRPEQPLHKMKQSKV